jgi:hypothetical protein
MVCGPHKVLYSICDDETALDIDVKLIWYKQCKLLCFVVPNFIC